MHPDADAPLADADQVRFDLELLADAKRQANRSLGWVIVGLTAVPTGFWAYLTVGWVQSGYTYVSSFFAISVAFGLLLFAGAFAARSTFRPDTPVRLTLNRSGVGVEYARGSPRSAPWEGRGPALWILDASRQKKGYARVSNFSCQIRGGRLFFGGDFGNYFPISKDTYDGVWNFIQSHNLTVASGPLIIPRGGTNPDVTVHRVGSPG